MSSRKRYKESVRPLVDRDRLVTYVGILQVVHELRGNTHTVMSMRDQLLRRYGYSKPSTQVELDLRLAEQLRYADKKHIDGACAWTLTQYGEQLVQNLRKTWSAIGESTSRQIERVAEAQAYGLGNVRVRHLVDVLLEALLVGGAANASVYRGGAFEDELPFRKRCDTSRVNETIERFSADPTTASFLKTLATLALDPTDPFGSDLVDHVEKSLVLQALDAACDLTIAHGVVGDLSTISLILDTPIFLRLARPSRDARVLERTLYSAIEDEGLTVLIPPDVEKEVAQVLNRFAQFESDVATAKGDQQRLGALISDRPTLNVWIGNLPSSQIPSLGEYRDRVQAHLEALKERAVWCPQIDETDLGTIKSFLEDELRLPGSKKPSRGYTEIRRDAKTILIGRHARLRHPNHEGVFSSVFVLTTDTHIGKAYRRQFPSDQRELTMTIKDFVSLQLVCRKPPSLDELAETARLLKHEHFAQIVARFSRSAAMRVSERLRSDFGSPFEVGIAEIKASELLKKQPDLIDHPDEAVALIAVEVLACWIEMVEEDRRSDLRTHQDQMAQLQKEINALRAQLDHSERERSEAKNALDRLRLTERVQPAPFSDDLLEGGLAPRAREQEQPKEVKVRLKKLSATLVFVLGVSTASLVTAGVPWKIQSSLQLAAGVLFLTMVSTVALVRWAQNPTGTISDAIHEIAERVVDWLLRR